MTAGRALRLTALAAAAAGAFFLLAAADLGLRSRGALRRAEQEDFWRANPAEKRKHFEALYAAGAAAGQAAPEAAARAAALTTAERDFKISESSAKMAYLWYKTAAEEFSSPLNPWAAKARKKMPGALGAWRAELKTRGVKAEDWMLE